MGIRAVANSSRIHIGRWLLAQAAALAALAALITSEPAVRVGFLTAAVALGVIAAGRFRRQPLVAWIPIAIAWCTRSRHRRADGSIGASQMDRDGIFTVLELGDPDAVVTSGRIRLPDLGTWAPLARGGPPVRVQILIQSTSASIRALLALRAVADSAGDFGEDSLIATLESSVRRAERRLRADGIEHRRLSPVEFVAATGLADATREAWDHVRVGDAVQVALTVPLGPDGMTPELLGRLTAPSDVATAITWAGATATVRLGGPDRAALSRTVNRLAGAGPARLLDGQHIRGRRATLALALDPLIATGSRHLTLPAAGVRIGTDRDGNQLCIRIRPDRDVPIRVTVVGGPAAARQIAANAIAVGIAPIAANATAAGIAHIAANRPGAGIEAAGVRANGERQADGGSSVPMRLDVLDRPTATDAPALRDADVVICQPLSPAEAAVVSTALGLSSRTGEWLTRVDTGMVAVIADGRVRWALLSPDGKGVSAVGRS